LFVVVVVGTDADSRIATERGCLARPPNDNLARCAKTTRRNQEVSVCFCQGDLCNGSSRSAPVHHALLAAGAIAVIGAFKFLA